MIKSILALEPFQFSNTCVCIWTVFFNIKEGRGQIVFWCLELFTTVHRRGYKNSVINLSMLDNDLIIKFHESYQRTMKLTSFNSSKFLMVNFNFQNGLQVNLEIVGCKNCKSKFWLQNLVHQNFWLWKLCQIKVCKCLGSEFSLKVYVCTTLLNTLPLTYKGQSRFRTPLLWIIFLLVFRNHICDF